MARKTATPRSGEVIGEYRESVHVDLPAYRFTLTGAKPTADSAQARVHAIEIRKDDESQPFQVIGEIDAETSLDHPGAFELIDMNFDGYRDMRLIASLPAGPNIPYRNWLFDRASGGFQPSPELDSITSAVFDPASNTIHSAWRDSASHYGEDTYRYIDGAPALVRREERRYSEPGVFQQIVSERAGEDLKVVSSKTMRE